MLYIKNHKRYVPRYVHLNVRSFIFIGPSRRKKRSTERNILRIVKQIQGGIQKLVDGYISYSIRGTSNALQTKGNVHQSIDKIVSDIINDIDTRLNKPKDNTLDG